MVERRRTHSLLASDIARGWFAVGLGTVALTFALLVARAMFTAGGGGVWWALLGATYTFSTLVELTISRTQVATSVMVLAVLVAVSSLALIVVAFAVNYAREDAVSGGLAFPGDERPRFIDYVYLAAQVSTTFGGSDVAVTRSRMRRILTTHGAISFVFNSVIVALLVSILAGGIR